MNATLLTALAKRALIAELETTPKPGLVDLKDNGSHTDMDFALMSRGIDAVCPFFGEMFDGTFGLSLEGKSASDLTRALRQQGLAAEKAMYGATGGINTHKGAIFSIGFVSGALGLLSSEGREFEPNEICGAVKTLAAGIEVELLDAAGKTSRALTAGENFPAFGQARSARAGGGGVCLCAV